MKKILFIICIVAIMLMNVSFAMQFTDLDETHWGYQAVNSMKKDGVIRGYEDNSFMPNKKVTRAEFAKMFVEALNLDDEEGEIELFDMDETHWAYRYAKIMVNYLPLEEDEDTELPIFNPDDEMLRQEVAYAVMQVIGSDEDEGYDEEVLNSIVDNQDIDDEFKQYVALAIEYGVLNGHDDGTFKPKDGLTRVQIAQVMKNVCEFIDLDSYVLEEANDAEFEVSITNDAFEDLIIVYDYDEDEITQSSNAGNVKVEEEFEDFVDSTPFDKFNSGYFESDNQYSVSYNSTGKITTNNHTHIFLKYVSRPATCKQTGLLIYKCSKCGLIKQQSTIAKTNHKFSSWSVTRKPTCNQTGISTRTCSLCGTKETKTIAKTTHSWSGWSTISPNSCVKAGTQQRRCSICGKTEQKSVSAKGHAFGSYIVTKPATCTATGMSTSTCSKCGLTRTKTIAKIAHSFNKNGLCTKCGYRKAGLPVVTKVTITPAKDYELKVGEKVVVKGVVDNPSNRVTGGGNFTWSASPAGIVELSTAKTSTCVITGKSAGTATVTVKHSSGNTDSCTVVVVDNTIPEPPVEPVLPPQPSGHGTLYADFSEIPDDIMPNTHFTIPTNATPGDLFVEYNGELQKVEGALGRGMMYSVLEDYPMGCVTRAAYKFNVPKTQPTINAKLKWIKDDEVINEKNVTIKVVNLFEGTMLTKVELTPSVENGKSVDYNNAILSFEADVGLSSYESIHFYINGEKLSDDIVTELIPRNGIANPTYAFNMADLHSIVSFGDVSFTVEARIVDNKNEKMYRVLGLWTYQIMISVTSEPITYTYSIPVCTEEEQNKKNKFSEDLNTISRDNDVTLLIGKQGKINVEYNGERIPVARYMFAGMSCSSINYYRGSELVDAAQRLMKGQAHNKEITLVYIADDDGAELDRATVIVNDPLSLSGDGFSF